MLCDTKVHTGIVKFIQGILGFIKLIPIIVLSLYRVIQRYTGIYIGWYWIWTCWWSLFGLITNNIGLILKVIQVDTIYTGWTNNIGLILKVIQVDTIYTGWIEFYSCTEWMRLIPQVSAAILIFTQGDVSTVLHFMLIWNLSLMKLTQGDSEGYSK